MRKILFLWVFFSRTLLAQDSLQTNTTAWRWIAPTALIGGGLVALQSSTKQWQRDWHAANYSTFSNRADDYLQFAPSAITFGLDIMGVKGRHNFKDKVIITLIANTIAVGTTVLSKSITKIERPNGLSDDSFPSGHTAFAFTNATILSKEYGHVSPVYSIVGFGIAGTVGTMRMLNNKHWLSDVLVGAGVGILATETTYAMYPWLQKKIFKQKNMAFLPVYNGQVAGVSGVIIF